MRLFRKSKEADDGPSEKSKIDFALVENSGVKSGCITKFLI